LLNAALQTATNYRTSRIQLETDSSVLKQTLLSSSMDLAACGMLIKDTRFLLRKHFVCSAIFSIPRSCNSVAHELAKLALCWDPGELHVWFVKTLVARDSVEPVVSIERP
jgi:hypothetical protein